MQETANTDIILSFYFGYFEIMLDDDISCWEK
jgi:hypothetical protein